MTKLFTGLPPEIEHYNPDEKWEDFHLERREDAPLNTFDEEGKLHSFNDFPSSIEYSAGWVALNWHSHGKLFREGKPFQISLLKDPDARNAFKVYEYVTTGDDGRLQSYGAAPAYISQNVNDFITVYLEWSQDSEADFAKDVPKIIRFRKGSPELQYFIGPTLHRGNDLPAIVSKHHRKWLVLGNLHRETGASLIRQKTHEDENSEWFLYGISVSEKRFNRIKYFQKKHSAPFWVAFLHEVKLANKESLKPFMDRKNQWNTVLPDAWVVKALGITEDNWNEMHKTVRKHKVPSFHNLHPYAGPTSSLEYFLKVVSYKEKFE